MYVVHKCDNPSCINPADFELGTQAENMRPKIVRGRQLCVASRLVTLTNTLRANPELKPWLIESDKDRTLAIWPF
jgi:hypothetical protein